MTPINPVCALGGPTQGGCSLGGGSGIGGLTSSLVFAPIVSSVLGGASFVLHATSQVLGETTSPQLTSTWFSPIYWRVAGIGAVLTLPFLFAAALQALVRSDLSLLLRATLGYLPLAVLAVTIAAPLTMLLLAASDQLSATVSSAAGQQGAHFLGHAVSLLTAIAATVASPFVLFMVGLLTVAGALVLWIELLIREAAVYVIVLMLPLAFAAFVWPARRVWAVRSLELLIALILSKFVIVAVLSLGGAALDHSAGGNVTGLLAGGVLLALAAFSPWALVRLIPLSEVASSAAGSLSAGSHAALHHLQQSDARASQADHWASKTMHMRNAAADAASSNGASVTKQNADANAESNPPGERSADAETSDLGSPRSRQPSPPDAPAAEPSSPPDASPAERSTLDIENAPQAQT